MLEAVADAGLLLEALRLSGCHHALAHQVTACLYFFLQLEVSFFIEILNPWRHDRQSAFRCFATVASWFSCLQPRFMIFAGLKTQASG